MVTESDSVYFEFKKRWVDTFIRATGHPPSARDQSLWVAGYDSALRAMLELVTQTIESRA